MTKIEKTAKNIAVYHRDTAFFGSARDGFHYLLSKFSCQNCVVLLPSYIGVSPNEGSGIFDPVTQSNVPFLFYRMDDTLHIDIGAYQKALGYAAKQYDLVVVLIVHYFGFVDPKCELACQYAKSVNAIVIEDEAHALYTDFVDGACGCYGDYSIFSLHKMLPLAYGGMVRDNRKSGILHGMCIKNNYNDELSTMYQYDFKAISRKRKEIARILYDQLEGVRGITFLRQFDENITPQTIPITISEKLRNDFYFTMNAAGYGVVSLYHTLIGEISGAEYGDSVSLSRRITNLPTHQDADIETAKAMCAYIIDYMERKAKDGFL